MPRPVSVLLCLLALLLAVPAVAQKDKSKKSKKELQKEEAYNMIAQETCDCMSGKDVTKMKSSEIEMQLGICMISSFTAHADVIGEDAVLNDPNSMEQLGQKVGVLMLGKCPQILLAVASGMQDETMIVDEGVMPQDEEDYWDGGEEVTGAIVRMSTNGDVSYLIMKDDAGVEHELMWLRYFEGSDSLLENPDSGIGRKATVYWVPMECYSPKTKDYAVRKEIRALTFVE